MKKLLKRLVIDSATKYLYISLLDGDTILEEYYDEGHNDHSVVLMPTIEEMMNKWNLKVADLNEIIVGIGPGSYTGLRVGVVIAKMFGWNNSIPVKTVSSLALLASASDEEYVLAEIDARRGNSFLGLFQNASGVLKAVSAEELTNLEEYKENANKIYSEVFVSSMGKPNILKVLNSPLLTKVENIHELNPNYLRVTEAERNLSK
jgi:tRNA threonylcarbamoyladenosine biosynthesis protein TsaB